MQARDVLKWKSSLKHGQDIYPMDMHFYMDPKSAMFPLPPLWLDQGPKLLANTQTHAGQEW